MPLPAPLGAGRYDVTVVTMDDHTRALFPDRAAHEQVVIALEPPPTLGAHTLPTQDLPDDLDRIESSVGTLAVDRDTGTVFAVHRSIPEPWTGSGFAFANSIVPEEITFRCLSVPPTTTTLPATTTSTSTSTTSVPASSTTVPPLPSTTVPSSTTVPPTFLPSADPPDVIDQILRTGGDLEGNVPSAPAAVETNFVPTYNG